MDDWIDVISASSVDHVSVGSVPVAWAVSSVVSTSVRGKSVHAFLHEWVTPGLNSKLLRTELWWLEPVCGRFRL